MRVLRFFAGILFVVPLLAFAAGEGDWVPGWELESADGELIEFPKHAQGKPSILFFWATWCPYCHSFMPYLQKIREDYAGQGVNVYAVDFKDDGDPAGHMAELGYDFIVLPYGDLIADDYGVWAAPGILVIDGEGVVRYRRKPTKAPPGATLSEVWDTEVREALGKLLPSAK